MQHDTEIKDFKIEFNKHFHSTVMPMLLELEKLRHKNHSRFITVVVFSVILGGVFIVLANVFNSIDFYIALLVPVLIVSFVFTFLKKNVENAIKQKAMPVLMKAFGDFHWTQEQIISTSIIRSSSIIDNSFEERSNDDSFYGTFKDIKLAINETELTYTTKDSKGNRTKVTVFDGLLIQLDMNKNFNGHTIILKDSLIKFGTMNLKRVALEDPIFEKFFDVYSDDQVEARYLLTTAFMERFKNLILVFKTKAIKCSFKDEKILIALDVRKDMFKLGNLFTPVTDTAQYEELFNQIASIFTMINVLKLDMKIGM